MEMSSDLPSATATYDASFSIQASETLGSVEIQFCSNSPLIGANCVSPAGFSLSGATLADQTGTSGFIISPLSNTNTLILTRAPATEAAGSISFTMSGVVNPSSTGTFYARVQTFATTDASGSPNDTGGIALAISSTITINTKVLPYLLFCTGVSISSQSCNDANGSYIDFGDLSTKTTGTGQSQLLVATNAQSGYSIQVNGPTMTSGNNIINPLTTDSPSIPGQDQFGLNLVENTSPSVGSNVAGPGTGAPLSGYVNPNYFKYNNGDIVASSEQASDYREYTISYIINIASSQPPGYYATTLTYVGLANF
jgi:hypothetical protein